MEQAFRLVIFLFGYFVVGQSSDMYTSSVQIQKLLNSERSLLVFLEDLFTKYSRQNNTFERALYEVQSDMQSLQTMTSSSANHPLDAVIGLHRYCGYVDRYINILPVDMMRKVIESYTRIGLTLPSKATLDGSQRGLLRLQSTYKLTPRVLITSSTANVTARECVSMATAAKRVGKEELASDWLDIAENIGALKKREREHESNKDTCLKHFHHRQDLGQKGNTDDLKWKEHEQFEFLCSKYINKDSLGSLRKSSTCRYSSGTVPIVRWKVEELSSDPLIILYHDVISDFEADLFIHLGTSMLERATTGESPRNGTLHDLRTSKLSWLWDNHTAIVERVSGRVAAITGLSTEFRDTATLAEPFQVVNYGIGGYYAPHYDYYVNPDAVKTAKGITKDSGDRLATFMFYLSEVGSGGGTVFPDLGVGAPPVKNAALFWYNFHPDGTRDERTKHGGCPVLCGHKWVANKWIRQISGAMTSQCPVISPL